MIFDLFDNTAYTFLRMESATGGNRIVQEYPATGVVKLRGGMVDSGESETRTSASSVHIKPTEPFIAAVDGNLVGHGIRVQNGAGIGVDCRIDSQSEGRDFDTGKLDFYRVTLKKESVWTPSDLPLT